MKSSVIPVEYGEATESAMTDILIHQSARGEAVDSRSLVAATLEEAALEDGSKEEEESSISIPIHPLGLKPLGNIYTATSNARHGLSYFQILPDEVVAVLLEYFDFKQLQMLSSTCKFFYAFCRSEELWKTLFLEWVLFR